MLGSLLLRSPALRPLRFSSSPRSARTVAPVGILAVRPRYARPFNPLVWRARRALVGSMLKRGSSPLTPQEKNILNAFERRKEKRRNAQDTSFRVSLDSPRTPLQSRAGILCSLCSQCIHAGGKFSLALSLRWLRGSLRFDTLSPCTCDPPSERIELKTGGTGAGVPSSCPQCPAHQSKTNKPSFLMVYKENT